MLLNKEIITNIKNKLLGNLTQVLDENIKKNRCVPIDENETPLVNIFIKGFSSKRNDTLTYLITPNIFIEIVAHESILDDIQNEIITILLQDDTLNGIFSNNFQITEGDKQYNFESESKITPCILTFTGTYGVNIPDTPNLDDLKTISVKNEKYNTEDLNNF